LTPPDIVTPRPSPRLPGQKAPADSGQLAARRHGEVAHGDLWRRTKDQGWRIQFVIRTSKGRGQQSRVLKGRTRRYLPGPHDEASALPAFVDEPRPRCYGRFALAFMSIFIE
jgi:hypothetical protein